MFMKTGRKFLQGVLFSPTLKTRLATMSMMSALIPLALAIGPQAAATPVTVAVSPTPAPVAPAPVVQPVTLTPVHDDPVGSVLH